MSLGTRQQTRSRSQSRFTLIELLVAISILGILAAVVTMSTVGITAVVKRGAAEVEKHDVQVAMNAMLADQEVPLGAVCREVKFQGPPGAGTAGANTTNDMKVFPIDRRYTAARSGGLVALYPHYLRQPRTHGYYHCVVEKNADGTTRQDAGRVEQDWYSAR